MSCQAERASGYMRLARSECVLPSVQACLYTVPHVLDMATLPSPLMMSDTQQDGSILKPEDEELVLVHPQGMSLQSSSSPPVSTLPSVPDGGWTAWLTVFGAYVILCHMS